MTVRYANRLVAGQFVGTWDALEPVSAPSAAAFFVPDSHAAARVAWTHATTARETLLAAASRAEPALTAALRASGLAIVGPDWQVQPPTQHRDPVPGRLWLLTSGSTGRPKQVAHTLESLTTVRGEQPERTWLCPYTPGAYAWWQVVTLGLGVPGQHIVFVEADQVDSWPALALEHGVTAASGTPTFWRQALMRHGDTLARLDLRQLTLGGEPVDQAILTTLTQTFPQARISWIYASSEAGASITVHDGKAGFPEEWLTRHIEGKPQLSIDGDELLISSPHRGEGIDQLLRTGDRVERRDGRVLIVGRLASDEINVGGSKASASEIRDVLLSHPAVAWAAVKPRRAPLVGTVVAADVVLSDPAVTEADLIRYCADRLADYAVPRRLRVLDSIELKESLKSDV